MDSKFERMYDFYVGDRSCERGYTYDELCRHIADYIPQECAADDLLPVFRTENGYVLEDQTLSTLSRNRIFRRNVISGINAVLDYYGIEPDGNSLIMADDFDLKASRWQDPETGYVIGQLVACCEFYGMHTLAEKIYRFTKERKKEGTASISRKDMKIIKRSRPETTAFKIVYAVLSAAIAVLTVVAVGLMIYVGMIVVKMKW